MRVPEPLAVFLRSVVALDAEQGGCWRWLGQLNEKGYGYFRTRREGKRVIIRAHRFAYEHFIAPIPQGLEIDHLCRNRWCSNPDHLEAVTRRENQRRGEGFSGVNWRKTHCPKGHEYSPENTRTSASGKRHCRTCHRERMSRSK